MPFDSRQTQMSCYTYFDIFSNADENNIW